jgi:APA family basic amino acid/polyamine antiporter
MANDTAHPGQDGRAHDGRAQGPTLGLTRTLGAWGLGASVFNTVVGAGIFVLPATLGHQVGAAAPLVYLACALAMGGVALCFAAAGSRVPTSGGPAGYVEAAFGPLAGFVVGVLIWLGAVLAAAGIAAAIADNVSHVLPSAAHGPGRSAFIVALIGMLAVINIAGVKPGVRLVGVMTAAKLLPLVALLAAGAALIQPAHFAISQGVHPAAGFGRAMILALFAFQGMETALSLSGEVRHPARNVPLGLLGAMGAVTVLYIALQIVAQGVLGPALGGSTTPLADAAARVSPALGQLLLAGAGISMLGYLASDALSAPRLLYTFARKGLLPQWLAQVSAVTHAPFAAILFHAGLAMVLALSGSFAELATLSSLTTVVVYMAGCVAAVTLQHRKVAEAGPPLRTPGLLLAAAVGVAGMVWIAIHATPLEALGLVGTLAVSAGWYALARVLKRGKTMPRA